MAYTYEYPRPAVTADVIAILDNRVLLIQRRFPPYQDSYALPGGFIDEHEQTIDAAVRELHEETGVSVTPSELTLLGIYDQPERDPRGRTISAVYYTHLHTEPTLQAGDDACAAQWFDLNNLPDLAFDHAEIMRDFSKRK